MTSALSDRSTDILARLTALRQADAPTHGGRVLSYVYDSGLAELDELAAEAIRIMQPVNGLDPTTFPSVAAMERDLVGFARRMLHGGDDVTGSVTSGGTESCLLAVKTARDVWRAAGGAGAPRLVAPVTVHAAFSKAAQYLGLDLDLVPVSADGQVAADALTARFGPDVALVVVSAPAYPHASLDPIAAVAAAAQAAGIACHVDACIGGWVLPWWSPDDPLPTWDFAAPGVTSISADLHKFGYAPKGASVLLHRGRDRHRAQYFATRRWPGYPVVNATMLGSKSAGALAAAWAIVERLGESGFAELAASCRRSTDAVTTAIDAIDGLRVVGSPVGPLCAVATDESLPAQRRVDPHHWADRVRSHGWLLQLQPGHLQSDGSRLPHTTHLTITPVTESVLPDLVAALRTAADEVRGVPAVTADDVLGALPVGFGDVLGSLANRSRPIDSAEASALLAGIGIRSGGALPERMAPLLALLESLPAPLTERLLVELLAGLVDP
ncbi:aspartate aminotransferase family protein [Mycetocola manganoxydans]|uniref:Aspartate aminotransferase family protein n=1 Tax=Mycetocola manganoxydans TaxID=699879 RepID=A0A3L6ZY69_9MICO|nr:aminotransferase class V-fold PLP-dependent enzyme [Mycetocola manganoxydans]RLP72869.1 aspartate aminotransferase family protein [Mycetocola manganoxydans]GHD45231.1 aspartate aminotransferase family protein [Mycetocola manganoxydans]